MGSGQSVPAAECAGCCADLKSGLEVEKSIDVLSLSEDSDIDCMVIGKRQNQSVSAAETDVWIKDVLKDPKHRLAMGALSTNSPSTILQNPRTLINDISIFNLSIPFEGSPVTNQRSSGRCWLFASTNVFRIAIMKKYGLENFELSQSYLFFWDKVEKANYFLESILETAHEPADSRLVSTMMASPVGDGGQWDMVVNLVAKYGFVPQSLYPDSWNSKHSSFMDRLLTTKLREDALKLRKLKNSNSSTALAVTKFAKDSMMREVVRILTLTLGPPPSSREKFKWEFYTRGKEYKKIQQTPLEFAETIRDKHGLHACGGTDVQRLFSLVNDPRNSFMSLLTVNRLNNMWKGRPVTYVNVDQTTIKKACIEMLRRGWPVFFGSDVGKASDSKTGIMDTDLYDYELGFDIKLGLTKAQRLVTGESAMTHAMVLTAVHLSPSGDPIKWRVENSWSDSAGSNGYFVMSDRWMDEYCYQAVVDPAVVSSEVRAVLRQTPKILDLWDPMGALA